MTKVDIISGFLGAGKTTLIQKLLDESLGGEKVVLIENEYGEVGIDGGFLKDSGVQIRELNSGCICCTLVGDFTDALQDIIENYHPDRIIIEPSGVGKLSDVMKSVTPMEDKYDVKLNALVAVANAKKASKQMKAFGEFFNDQIANAAAVMLSRTQDLTQEKLDQCVAQIKEVNPKAVVITTPWDELTGDQILKAMEGQNSLMEEMLEEFKKAHANDEPHEHHHHHHDHDHHHEHDHDHDHHHDHDADDVFVSWGVETPHKYTKEKIESILKTFVNTEDYGAVLRSKGMVPAEDGSWIYFDMVPGDYEIREGSPEVTGRICVIGTDIDEDKLSGLFELN